MSDDTFKEVVITSSDIMLHLCDSLTYVMSTAAEVKVTFTPMVQRIRHTTLRPDIGTFVLFTGSFSGMVVLNFSKEAAMEIYSSYMRYMGFTANEISQNYTSDDVAATLGELMNQIIGNFTGKVSSELHSHITQNQPKMLTLPQHVELNINMSLDNPIVRRITFKTASGAVFYLELAMDDTDFTKVREFEEHSQLSPDEILEQAFLSK